MKLSRSVSFFSIGLLALCGLTLPLAAQTTTLKIGTLAGDGTPWHQTLQEMGQKWRETSGGKIKVTIYAGTLGDEADIIRKMRINQIQVAAVTSVGLDTIAKEMSALSIPLLFRDWDEVDYVRTKIAPRLEKILEEKGFVVLNWGDAGWVRFFSVRPAPTLNDLRRMKLFVWAGDPRAEELYKDAGFKPVPLPPTEILQSLQTGVIEAFPAPPIGALGFQWFGLAKNMLDLNYAPIVGATIMTKSAWDKLDPPVREAVLKESRAAGERLKEKVRQLENTAIEEMKKRGLKVITMTPEAEREWRQTAQQFWGRIRGEIVRPNDFDEVVGLVNEYRESKKK